MAIRREPSLQIVDSSALDALPVIDPVQADDLIARYIHEDTLGRDESWVTSERGSVQVWALIGYLRGGDGIVGTTLAYDQPEEAVTAAVAYYQRLRPLFDAKLLLNDEFANR